MANCGAPKLDILALDTGQQLIEHARSRHGEIDPTHGGPPERAQFRDAEVREKVDDGREDGFGLVAERRVEWRGEGTGAQDGAEEDEVQGVVGED